MTLTGLDTSLFREINGLAGRSVWLDAALIFGAVCLIFVMAALIAAYVAVAWKTSHFEGRIENVTHASLTVIIAYIFNHLVGFLWFRPRPFVVLQGVIKLIDKSALDKSFPSDHAVAAFGLAFGLLMHNRKWGWPLVGLAAIVGFSRVAVGVHYPSDILAGAAIALVAALITAPVKKALDPILDWVPGVSRYKKP